MAETYKVLGQAALAATTLTPVYTVPAARSAVISSVVLCNRAGAGATCRVSVAIAGAADTVAQYLIYDVSIDGNATITLQLGITLATTDVIRAFVSTANISINVFGTEIS